MPSFNDWLYGKKDRVKQRTLLSKEQEELHGLINQALTAGEGPLADIFGEFNPEEFEKGVAEPEMKRFMEKILPLISEKYIASNQAGTSSMRKGELGAASDFQSNLASLLYQAREAQKNRKLQGVGLQQGTQTFENQYQQGHPGALAEFGTAVFQGAGKKIGEGVAGGLGA